jgi:hypothetical protein
MRLLRSIVLANALAAILLAGVVIAMRPRDVQGGVVSRGNAMGMWHSWVTAPPTPKAPHGTYAARPVHDANEIDVRMEPLNQKTGTRFHSSHPPSGMSPEES